MINSKVSGVTDVPVGILGDMPYHERVGESKLKVGKDGIRFLQVILKTAAIYRPARLAGIAIAGGLVVCGSLTYLLRRRMG